MHGQGRPSFDRGDPVFHRPLHLPEGAHLDLAHPLARDAELGIPALRGPPRTSARNSENSKANRIETMKGPAESGQICSVGRRKIAKKIAKNKRCYANTLRPRSRIR